ncbi:hypothetical protein EVAR_92345_1 [Eumeta japonica]|uniref:Uncharacterized protein n=1 Tax=Eumeta variegata TaxID=151549 RepID=A0A4C1TJI1_EUMVA|nr:hypothetical protein EVAR_92345_1 [Eumeta japonica]
MSLRNKCTLYKVCIRSVMKYAVSVLAHAHPSTLPTPDSAKQHCCIDTQQSQTGDIKVLLSVITSLDIGKLALLVKKFKAAANPVEKIVVLVEHTSLVDDYYSK